MNKKNTAIVILVLLLIALAGFTYYLYSGAMKCKAVATDLGAKLKECGAGVEKLKAGLNECMAGAKKCQDAITALSQIPTCAPYIPAQ